MIKDSFLIALKNLKHRGARSWLTLLGIFIGITAVVSLISLGNGLQLAVSSQFGISQTELITVKAGGISGAGPPGSLVVNPLTDKDLKEIKDLSSVKRATARIMHQTRIEFNDKIITGYVASVPSGEDRQFIYDQLDKPPVAGRLLKDSDVGKVFLGYNYYVDNIGLEKEIIPGKKIIINGKEFIVSGILDKKGSFIFDNVIYMNEQEMKDLFSINDTIDAILVQPTEKNEIVKAKQDIERLLRKRRDVNQGEEDFTVSTPEASLESVNSILKGVKIFIVIVASISIFIGSLGIINTMTTSILERKREIGVMKSVGAKNSHIFEQFFIESGLLGLLGGLAGIIFGTLIGIMGTSGINSFLGADIKMKIDFALIFFSLVGSFIIGALAGIIPAMKAAKQNPVDALRS